MSSTRHAHYISKKKKKKKINIFNASALLKNTPKNSCSGRAAVLHFLTIHTDATSRPLLPTPQHKSNIATQKLDSPQASSPAPATERRLHCI